MRGFSFTSKAVARTPASTWGYLPGSSSLINNQGRSFFGPFKKQNPEEGTPGSSASSGMPKSMGDLNMNSHEMPAWAKKLAASAANKVTTPKQLDHLETSLDHMEKSGMKPPAWTLNMQEKSYVNMLQVKKHLESLGPEARKAENYTNLVRSLKLSERMFKIGGRPIPGGGGPTVPLTTSSKSVASSGSSNRATTAPQQPPLQEPQVDLGSETEELFAELKTMREKRNSLKESLEKKSAAFDTQKKELGRLTGVEADLRSRLKLAENNVALLNSETLDLREKSKDARANQQKLVKLERTVKALESQDTAPLAAEISTLKSNLDDKNEVIRSLQRKLDRSRRHSPLNQFSNMLSDIAKAGGPSYDSGSLEVGFQTLQDAYHTQLQADWNARAEKLGAREALFNSCVQYLYATLPRAKLDALVTPTNEAEWLKVMQMEDSFIVVPAPQSALGDEAVTAASGASTGSYIVRSKDPSTIPKISPYALVYALHHQGVALCNKVSPFLTTELVTSPTRSRVEMETARSSGPGGQAANVCETQVTLKLFLDDILMITSHSSDTRSAYDNKKLANDRLYSESVAHWNNKARGQNQGQPLEVKHLRRFAANKNSGEAKSSAALKEEELSGQIQQMLIAKDNWDTTLDAFRFDGNTKSVESAVIQLVRAATI